ncbi:MAG: A24 family peptidase [Clostridia bacterium]|nr:A24 family peptidase [Clostridia bacterium]
MYINDINILNYIVIGVIAIIAGFLTDWANIRLPKYERVFSKDFFKIYLKSKNKNKILVIVTVLIYLVLLYFSKINYGVLYKIDLIKYLLLAPMLMSAFIIDYKIQIIPNRLNLTMFEVGLVTAFLGGIFGGINVAIDMLIGMFVGGGIFLIITAIGGLIAGKEAMGLGDVKLMGALGLFFGFQKIIAISVIAFLIAAVVSIIILIFNKKRTEEYIPFGPFIVLASFVVILIPFDIIITMLFEILTLGTF